MYTYDKVYECETIVGNAKTACLQFDITQSFLT